MSDKKPTFKTADTLIPLSDIALDWSWNSRTPVRGKHGEVVGVVDLGQGATSFEELKNSIGQWMVDKRGGGSFTADGPELAYQQNVPVLLRPNPKGTPPYVVVAGFSRIEAITQIAKSRGELDKVRVFALVRPLDEAQARALNLQENTGRTELSVPDMVYGLSKLLAVMPRDERGRLSKTVVEELSTVIAKGPDHTGKLVRLTMALKPTTIELWRKSITVVTLLDMETLIGLSMDPMDDIQEKAFLELAKQRSLLKESRNRRGPQWYDAARRQTLRLAAALRSCPPDVLQLKDAEQLAADWLPLFLDIPRPKAHDAKAQAIRVDHLRKAFLDAMKGNG